LHPVVVSVENLSPDGKVVPLQYPAPELDELAGLADLEGVRGAGELTGEARLLPSGRDVFLLGRFRARVAYPCVRCLEPFEDDVAGEFHLVFTTEEGEGDEESELHREDLDVETLRSPMLDLTGVVEEQFLLALRPHPVCRESCQGLCPNCGGNRNLAECRCDAPPGDPRFAVLRNLKKGDAD
jgi:uncharacterized protein